MSQVIHHGKIDHSTDGNQSNMHSITLNYPQQQQRGLVHKCGRWHIDKIDKSKFEIFGCSRRGAVHRTVGKHCFSAARSSDGGFLSVWGTPWISDEQGQ